MNTPGSLSLLVLFAMIYLVPLGLAAQEEERRPPNPTILLLLENDIDALRSELLEQEEKVTFNRRNARDLDTLIRETRAQLSEQRRLLDSVFAAAQTVPARPSRVTVRRPEQTVVPAVPAGYDRSWVLLVALLGWLSLVGYQVRELGLLRYQHSDRIGIKHLAAWLLGGLLFYGIGFNLLFAPGGLAGWDSALLFPTEHDLTTVFLAAVERLPDNWPAPDFRGLEFVVLHIALATTVLSILSGALAERTRFFAFLLFGGLALLLIYPLFGHWAWGTDYLPYQTAWLGNLGFYDLAGSTVVHSVAGWVALAGLLIVGPRTGKFTEDGPVAFAPTLLSYSVLGVFLIWIGTLLLNLAAWSRTGAELGTLAINLTLSACAAGSAAFGYAYWRHRERTYQRCLGGTLTGVVAACAGAQLYDPGAAILLGAGAGLLHNLAAEALLRRRWDDPIGAVPVHLCGGIWGTLGIALLGNVARFPRNVDILAFGGEGDIGALESADLLYSRLDQLFVQGLGVMVAGLWAFGMAWGLLQLLRRRIPLRLTEAEELGEQ